MSFSADHIRNIVLAGHSGSGKTTLVESILFTSGAINRQGSVDDGNTQSDFHKEEIERKISIQTTLLTTEWHKHRINLLDTPGFADFIGEVRCAMRAADVVLTVVHGVGGVEVGTDHAVEAAKERGIGFCFFVNCLDRENADFDKVYHQIRESYGNGCVALQYPIGVGKETFHQIIDIVQKKLLVWNDTSGKATIKDIPAEYQEKVETLRKELIEYAAEADDELIEKYFESGELTDEELDKGIRLGILKGKVHPILCGSAKRTVGIDDLLDLLIEFCPSPIETGPVLSESGVERKQELNAPALLQVFKSMNETHVGDISVFRVWAGTVKTGDELVNARTGKVEKINSLFLLNGKNRKLVDSVSVGELAGTIKLKETITGDTLCDPNDLVQLKRIEFPPPVYHLAIECKTKGDEDKLSSGLSQVHFEDPTFLYHQDTELGQTIISGQGDIHLAVCLATLKEKVGIELETNEPKIPYREAIRTTAEAEGKHKKQTGGRGQFAIAVIRIEPKDREGEPLEFVDAIVGGVVGGKFIPAVEKGIAEAMKKGVIAGYPVIGVKATLFDGKEHPVDSSETAFKLAGSKGFREAALKAKPVVLEPIFDLEVKVPEAYMGDVMGDLSSRRGKIIGMDSIGHYQQIRAKIPQAEIMKYSMVLRSMTGGRGFFRVKFSHYEEVPPEIQKKLEEQYQAKRSGQVVEEE
ncbi:MAG: elongation factor G [bacterium]|nr:elongation factor G [bacterium]